MFVKSATLFFSLLSIMRDIILWEQIDSFKVMDPILSISKYFES